MSDDRIDIFATISGDQSVELIIFKDSAVLWMADSDCCYAKVHWEHDELRKFLAEATAALGPGGQP